MERYITSEKVGKGTYGVVFKAKDKKTGELVALKTIQLDEDEGIPSTAVREIALLKYLKHPNVVSLHDVIHMADKLTMVFEFLELDLKKYLDACGSNGLEVITVKSLLYQLLSGVAFCHKQRVLHRDLKPANLLLNRAGILKLADFGLARTFSMDVREFKHEVITLWYRSPELLMGSTHYSTEVDLWSVGCIFAEMINGYPTFPGANDAEQLNMILSVLGTPNLQVWPEQAQLPGYKNMKSFPAKSWKKICSRIEDDGLNLLSRLLHFNPKSRITAEEAMAHPFFQDLKRRGRKPSNAGTGAPGTASGNADAAGVNGINNVPFNPNTVITVDTCGNPLPNMATSPGNPTSSSSYSSSVSTSSSFPASSSGNSVSSSSSNLSVSASSYNQNNATNYPSASSSSSSFENNKNYHNVSVDPNVNYNPNVDVNGNGAVSVTIGSGSSGRATASSDSMMFSPR
jgi:serine/threonine protein kinase